MSTRFTKPGFVAVFFFFFWFSEFAGQALDYVKGMMFVLLNIENDAVRGRC
jgi:hypothetical protein